MNTDNEEKEYKILEIIYKQKNFMKDLRFGCFIFYVYLVSEAQICHCFYNYSSVNTYLVSMILK